MKRLALLSALLLTLLVAAPPAEAQASSVLEQRLKASYNGMVRDVRLADAPAEKRAIIAEFLGRMDRGLAVVEKMSPASDPSRLSAARMREDLQARLDELNRMDAQAPNAGATLNHFAAYLQQDVERADGIYLSVGALIIILLILIILL